MRPSEPFVPLGKFSGKVPGWHAFAARLQKQRTLSGTAKACERPVADLGWQRWFLAVHMLSGCRRRIAVLPQEPRKHATRRRLATGAPRRLTFDLPAAAEIPGLSSSPRPRFRPRRGGTP